MMFLQTHVFMDDCPTENERMKPRSSSEIVVVFPVTIFDRRLVNSGVMNTDPDRAETGPGV